MDNVGILSIQLKRTMLQEIINDLEMGKENKYEIVSVAFYVFLSA